MELFVTLNELMLKAVLSSTMTSLLFLIFKYHFKNQMSEVLWARVCMCMCMCMPVTKDSVQRLQHGLLKHGWGTPEPFQEVAKATFSSYSNEASSLLLSSCHLHGRHRNKDRHTCGVVRGACQVDMWFRSHKNQSRRQTHLQCPRSWKMG